MFQYQDEYESKYSGKIYGKRRARVINNQDPQKIGRVEVENLELFGKSKSTWAMPSYPFYGGRDSGFFAVPPVGSMVWLEFEEGLIDFPIYCGGFFPLVDDGHQTDGSPIENSDEYQDQSSSVPAHARGEYDGSDFGGLKGNYGIPQSEFEGEYGEVIVLRSPGGHFLEFDDTDGGERIQIHHSNGSHIEILSDGTINIISEGNIFFHSNKFTEQIEADKISNVSGNDTKSVGLDLSTTVVGNMELNVTGDSTENVGSVSKSSSGDMAFTSGGVLSMSASNLMEISSGAGINSVSFGDYFCSSVGKVEIVSLNSTELPITPFQDQSLNLIGQQGTARIVSQDNIGASIFGLEARGGVSGQVFIGNLDTVSQELSLGVGSIPLIKEPLVMGIQLSLYLSQLNTVLTTFATSLATTPFASVSGASAQLISGVNALNPSISSLNTESVYVSP